jgi:hypothetical protein
MAAVEVSWLPWERRVVGSSEPGTKLDLLEGVGRLVSFGEQRLEVRTRAIESGHLRAEKVVAFLKVPGGRVSRTGIAS